MEVRKGEPIVRARKVWLQGGRIVVAKVAAHEEETPKEEHRPSNICLPNQFLNWLVVCVVIFWSLNGLDSLVVPLSIGYSS